MIRSVLFDFDGTLADTRGIMVGIYNELAGKYGYAPIGIKEMTALSRLSIPERCRRLGVPLYKLPALKSFVTRRFREQQGAIGIYDGIPTLLEELYRMGLSLGIASSNDSELIRAVLRREGLERVFGSIAPSSSLFGKHKTLQSYKRANGYSDGELLYVGDELRDIEACKKAKVPVAAVVWGFDHEALLRKQAPDLLVRKPKEIAAWIRRGSVGV